MMQNRKMTRDILQELIDKKLSPTEIASLFGVGRTMVSHWKKKFQMNKTRTKLGLKTIDCCDFLSEGLE